MTSGVDRENGDIELQIPRDRDGTFTSRLVPKGIRHLGGLDDMTISKITDAVLEEVLAWQNRPLDSLLST